MAHPTTRRLFAAMITVALIGFAGCASSSKATYGGDQGAQASGENGDEEVIFPLTLLEAKTGKSIVEQDGMFALHDETDVFNYRDRQVVAFAKFAHIVDPETVKVEQGSSLRWKWYSPDGQLYADSKDLMIDPPGIYHPTATAYHAINIDGEKASTLAGEWKVILFVGTAPVAELPFRIERTYRPGS